ncbi:MAG: LacI family DNA-binding transcriptional regulator [Clostridia bacterium]
MSTIKDVAKYTGLSMATISKYLNGGNVLEKNRAGISEAINLLGYHVNRNARSLKTNRTMTVGVVMPTLSIPFFGSVLSGLDKCLSAQGYTTFACSYDFDKGIELNKLRLLSNNNVDGIVLAPESLTPADLEGIRHAQGKDCPIILVDRTIPEFLCDSVVIDNLNATYGAVEQLIIAGHKRIGIIVGPLHISTAYERMIGYLRVQADYGMATDETQIKVGNGSADTELIKVGNYDFESGHRLFNLFMDMPNPPTALCVTNYDMTLGAITAAHERGIALGDDMGFVGFDAVDMCRIISPPLAVMEQPAELMGLRAGELLLRRMSGDAEGFPHLLRLKSILHTPIADTAKHDLYAPQSAMI